MIHKKMPLHPIKEKAQVTERRSQYSQLSPHLSDSNAQAGCAIVLLVEDNPNDLIFLKRAIRKANIALTPSALAGLLLTPNFRATVT